MKTKIFKSIAILTVSLLTLTMYAQNTKSVKLVSYSPNSNKVRESNTMLSYLNDELKQNIIKLTEFTRFYPNEDAAKIPVNNESEVMKDLAKELETTAKFNPKESFAMMNDEAIEMEKIQKELEEVVKYKPSQEMDSQVSNLQDEFSRIQEELKQVVQYKPTNIQYTSSKKRLLGLFFYL